MQPTPNEEPKNDPAENQPAGQANALPESPSVSSANEAPAGLQDNVPPAARSRFGRFMAALLRWLIIAVALFALGVLAFYYQYYRPLSERAAQTESQLAQVQQDLDTQKSAVAAAEAKNTELQKQVDTAKADIVIATNRVYLQMVLTDVASARLALANKDGANARNSLLSAKTHLEQLIPAIKEKDGGNTDRADAILGRLTLAINELNRDARTAIADLDVLTRNLQDLEKDLFGE